MLIILGWNQQELSLSKKIFQNINKNISCASIYLLKSLKEEEEEEEEKKYLAFSYCFWYFQ